MPLKCKLKPLTLLLDRQARKFSIISESLLSKSRKGTIARLRLLKKNSRGSSCQPRHPENLSSNHSNRLISTIVYCLRCLYHKAQALLADKFLSKQGIATCMFLLFSLRRGMASCNNNLYLRLWIPSRATYFKSTRTSRYHRINTQTNLSAVSGSTSSERSERDSEIKTRNTLRSSDT